MCRPKKAVDDASSFFFAVYKEIQQEKVVEQKKSVA